MKWHNSTSWICCIHPAHLRYREVIHSPCQWQSPENHAKLSSFIIIILHIFLLYSQSPSSLPSPQLSVKSHTQSSGTHRPWEQLNSWVEQAPTDTGVNTRENANSSHIEPSGNVISLVIGCLLTTTHSLHLQVKHFVGRTNFSRGRACPHRVQFARIVEAVSML